MQRLGTLLAALALGVLLIIFALAVVQPVGWTPAGGTVANPAVYVNPEVTCSGSGTGINASNDNIRIINPEVHNCQRGAPITGDNVHIVGDPTRPGYASDSNPAFSGHNSGVVIDNGASNFYVGGVNGGELYHQDSYRPTTLQSGDNGIIRDNDTDDPGPGNGYPLGHNDAIVGIKAICYFTDIPASERSCHNVTIESNDVAGVDEEGISLDPNGNAGANSMVQGTGSVGSISAANDTVDLSGTWNGLDNTYVGSYLAFNTGGADGRILKITAVNAASDTLTVADPNNYLADAAAGNNVSIGAPFRNFEILNNNVAIDGGFCGICWGGFVFNSVVDGNLITGQPTRNYPADFHLRPDSRQGVRLGMLADVPGGPLNGSGQNAVSGYNTMTDNAATGNNVDMSWNRRGPDEFNGIPNYRANNTPGPGGENWATPGDFEFLSSDPNAEEPPPPPPPPDSDGDGFADDVDNCPGTSNPDQTEAEATLCEGCV